jgi:hypothetical protein
MNLTAGHHVVLQADGNLASLGSGSTAWVGPVQGAFFITVVGFWLAAVSRQILSWRRSDGERRQQLNGWPAGLPSAECSPSGPSLPIR